VTFLLQGRASSSAFTPFTGAQKRECPGLPAIFLETIGDFLEAGAVQA
jgi:hypothetical protein